MALVTRALVLASVNCTFWQFSVAPMIATIRCLNAKFYRPNVLKAGEGDKVRTEFRVRESVRGHRVELCRDGEPYVTFMDGLTREGAEREARSLTALWERISVPHLMRTPALEVGKTTSVDPPQAGRQVRIGDWT